MSNFVDNVFSIIADEVGEDAEVLQENPEIEFADLGVDMVLTRSIVSRLRKATGLDIPHGLLQCCPTVGSLINFLDNIDPAKDVDQPQSQTRVSPGSPKTKNSGPKPPLSIRLQGAPKSAKKNMFLLPDGSGSAMSYAFLPPVDPEICIYGLNSPFLTTPEDFLPIPEISAIWAAEIRRLQPRGPYILGGWSAGGYYCFEVAKYMMENLVEADGHPVQVDKLVMIDSPCRLVFDALPMIVVTTLADQGLIGNWGLGKKAPTWLLDHFNATIARVEEYKPMRMKLQLGSYQQKAPKVFVLWATSGVFPPGRAEASGLDMESPVTRFMLQDRQDFGPNGWDGLFPQGTEMALAQLPGNHFTVPFPPSVSLHTPWLASISRLVLTHKTIEPTFIISS